MEKRLQTILAHAGIASRRKAGELIESGEVKVDGRVVREKGFRLDPSEHEILIKGNLLPAEEKKYYFLFNKPRNVISTVEDTHGRRKITDFFSDVEARLYPVGRLDRNTTGLIILTNDGEFTNRLSHPRFEVEKEYRVTVLGRMGREQIERLENGVTIDGIMTAPCVVEKLEVVDGNTVLRMEIHEGRNRQVRKMVEAVGSKVLQLRRTKYAGLTLKGVPMGKYRKLTLAEITRLKRIGGRS